MLDGPGAVLEVELGEGEILRALGHWSDAVRRMTSALGWAGVQVASRTWQGAAELGLTAPTDCLYTATEVNEWAWLATAGWLGRDLGQAELSPGATPRSFDEALAHLQALVRGERSPGFLALERAAAAHGAPFRWNDESVWLGSGRWAERYSRADLPLAGAVRWIERRGVPTALVTGSNGKTTTTRMLAAMLHAAGYRTGHCCTDGVVVDGEEVVAGDYAGPVGAQTVLADRRVEAAVLETARGGLLRRGLTVAGADLAVVTNVQLDHFGEYGITDLDTLAAVKLVVAKGLRQAGWLVLNAADPRLRAAEPAVRPEVARAWFALDPLAVGGLGDAPVATLDDGRLVIRRAGERLDLGPAADVVIGAGGAARYNLGNALAAGLAAWCMGVPPAAIRDSLRTFGTDPLDNPGRLTIRRLGSLTILTDYAHNPEGLAGLLTVARSLGPERLVLLLGQAGNRTNEAVRALARAAWDFRPDHVVLKDLDSFLRGRAPGEVPAILADELSRLGMPADQMDVVLPEVEAARTALLASRPGDVLVLPVHSSHARHAVAALLDRLLAQGWTPGMPMERQVGAECGG